MVKESIQEEDDFVDKHEVAPHRVEKKEYDDYDDSSSNKHSHQSESCSQFSSHFDNG